jgi:hypothetical protein
MGHHLTPIALAQPHLSRVVTGTNVNRSLLPDACPSPLPPGARISVTDAGPLVIANRPFGCRCRPPHICPESSSLKVFFQVYIEFIFNVTKFGSKLIFNLTEIE